MFLSGEATARAESTTLRRMAGPPTSDWYLRDWMVHLGLRQADLVKALGWPKGRVSKFYNGTQPYHRDVVNELSALMGISPFELLMHPKEATALRRLRESAMLIAAEEGVPFHHEPRTGTGG